MIPIRAPNKPMEIERGYYQGDTFILFLFQYCTSIQHTQGCRVSKTELPPKALTHIQHYEARITPSSVCNLSPATLPPWLQAKSNSLGTASHAFSVYHPAILCRQLEKDFHVCEHAWMEAAAVQLLIISCSASLPQGWQPSWEQGREDGW